MPDDCAVLEFVLLYEVVDVGGEVRIVVDRVVGRVAMVAEVLGLLFHVFWGQRRKNAPYDGVDWAAEVACEDSGESVSCCCLTVELKCATDLLIPLLFFLFPKRPCKKIIGALHDSGLVLQDSGS